MAEWFKAHAWKACGRRKVTPGFEPRPLRQLFKTMNIHETWEKALKNTEIVRTRVQALMTFADTHVPYILLSESSLNVGDTVVRKGEVVVAKPALILPPNIPQFEGFELEDNFPSSQKEFLNFLYVRGVTLPSLKYQNKTYSLDVFEGKLSDAKKYYHELLQRKEDVGSGLILCPEDCWPFSLLIFICSQIAKNAQGDIQRILDDYQKKHRGLK